MKTEIIAKDYIDIYEVCDWNPAVFSKALKSLRYSDELIVNDDLDLRGTPIKSLVNIKEVGGYLNLRNTPIEDLGVLQRVGGWVYMGHTPLSKKYSTLEIRQMVDVKGYIYLK